MEERKGIFSEGKKYIKNGKNGMEFGKYLVIAIIAFITCCCIISFYFLVYRYDGLNRAWNKLMTILQPVIIGAVLAYLLDPVMRFAERHFKKALAQTKLSEKKVLKLSRYFGTFVAEAFMIAIVAILLGMLIPQFIGSVQNMMNSLPGEANNFADWIDSYLPEGSDMAEQVSEYINMGVSKIEDYITSSIMPKADTYISSITTGVIAVLKTLLNVIIGVIISIYILVSKERFIGIAKKLVYAVCDPKVGNKFIEVVRQSNKIFGGFISGKILDSAIIGVICYISLIIMKMPYALVVSVIVGVTNVVPFFGPYIGAVPSFVLIALTNPIKAVYFAIFILILQQIDGNIIGPKILGETIGISTFGVLFSILVGSGLFGILGMVLGVPVFAVIEYLVSELVDYVLRHKNMSESTDDYIMLDKVGTDDGKMIYPEQENK